MDSSTSQSASFPGAEDTKAQLARLKRTTQDLSTRNAKLAEMLKASREKLVRLHAQLEDLAKPTNTYGTFLEFSSGGRTAEIFTLGRRMRVNILPGVDTGTMVPGVQVRLGEGNIIVDVDKPARTGELAQVVEMIGANRALIADYNGQERVVQLAQALLRTDVRPPRAGDSVLMDGKAGYAFEVIPKTEVSRLALEEVPDVTYADIGGLDTQIEQINDAVELPFAHPELYREYDLHPPKGVLLYGPPGCGKTLIAKAVANSLSKRIGDGSASYFINVKGPELLNKYVGETERRIRLIFERARELAHDGRPVIVFFDEMESIFRTRGSGVSSDMETTVVPQLLTELDGVESLSNVIVIGATNREELIDPAILRPGRLDVKIRVDRPNEAGAREILGRYITEALPLAEPVDSLIDACAAKLFEDHPFVKLTLIDATEVTYHYRDFVSGAMIANVVDRAKKNAIKDQIAGRGRGITALHLVTAVDAENRESEDLPNTSSPDEWAKVIGRVGMRVDKVTILHEKG